MHTVLSLLKHLRFSLNISGKLDVMGSSPPPLQEGPFCSVALGRRRPTEDIPQKAHLPWRFPMGWNRSALGGQAYCSLHLRQWLEFTGKEEGQLCQESKVVLLAVSPNVPCVSGGQ